MLVPIILVGGGVFFGLRRRKPNTARVTTTTRMATITTGSGGEASDIRLLGRPDRLLPRQRPMRRAAGRRRSRCHFGDFYRFSDQVDYLKAVTCLHTHGVRSIPEPTFTGGSDHLNVPKSIDQHSPTFQNALSTRRKLIPRGLAYSD